METHLVIVENQDTNAANSPTQMLKPAQCSEIVGHTERIWS